jgi:DNA-binding transcriptional LysR family regulator
MNLRQAAYLVAVVEERSFTRAAARLHIAQPSLSQQVKALEDLVGVELVERSARGITPTAAGRAFIEEARSALAAADSALAKARAAGGITGGSLHVATVASLATWVLPRAVARWRASHPEVALRLTEYPDRRAMEKFMDSGGADVAVGPRPRAWSGPVCWIGYEKYVAIVPLSDPRAGQRDVDLATFADCDWVLYTPGHGMRDVVFESCAAAGFVPRGSVETRQVDAAARFAANGIGVALVPHMTVPSDLQDNRVDLADAPVREVVAFVRSSFSAASASFVDALTRYDIGLDRSSSSPDRSPDPAGDLSPAPRPAPLRSPSD